MSAVYAHNAEFSGPDGDVPVITENIETIPWDELDQWHPASQAEVAAYEAYWSSLA